MISADRLRDLKRADPFAPFALHMINGGRFRVMNPEPFSVFPPGIVVIAAENVIHRLDLDQIADMKVGLKAPPATERLRRLKRAEPFVPLVLYLADGRRFSVATAEHIAITLAGGTVIVFGRGDQFDAVDAALITDIEIGPGTATATRSWAHSRCPSSPGRGEDPHGNGTSGRARAMPRRPRESPKRPRGVFEPVGLAWSRGGNDQAACATSSSGTFARRLIRASLLPTTRRAS
jgi:hypothetical protein